MTPMHGRRVLSAHTLLIAALAALPFGVSALGAQPEKKSPPAASTAPQPETKAMAVAFDVAHTVVPTGRPVVIPFRVDQPPATDMIVPFTCAEGKGEAEIIRQGRLLAGEKLGFVRVRGLEAGECTLTSEGGGTLTLRVTAGAAAAPRDELSETPRIVTPVAGAWVWPSGETGIGVGVEWFDDGDAVLRGRTVKLELADGTRLEADEVSSRDETPSIRAAYTIPGAALKPGDLTLTPIAINSGGAEQRGQPIKLHVAVPAEGELINEEAEDYANASRPLGQNRGRIQVQSDPKCSGGKFTNHASSDPAVTYTPEVTEAGWYQLIVTAAGDVGGAGLPAIGLQMDGSQYPATTGRLATTKWHRVAIGTPIRVMPGYRAFTIRFDNDIAYKDSDRNMRLDKFELLRINTGGKPAIPQLGSGGDAMMAGGGEQMSQMAGMDAAASAGSINAMDMMMMAAASGGAGAEINDPDYLFTRPVRVAFKTPLDGMKLAGVLEVAGLCTWDGLGERGERGAVANSIPAPVTTLLVNGKEHSSQRSAAPRFWVDPSWFVKGANTIQMVAKNEAGVTAKSPVQTLTWGGDARPGEVKFHRFTVRDTAWDGSAREKMKPQNDIDEKRLLTVAGGVTYAIELPEDWAGTFRVYSESRGGGGKNGSKLIAKMKGAEAGAEAAPVAVPSYWDTTAIGTVTLTGGTKHLLIGAENAKGSPGVELQAVILEQVASDGGTSKPARVEVEYPPSGAKSSDVYMADAVVFSPVAGDGMLRSAELLIDGKSTGLQLDLTRQAGPFVLPLLARGIAPGAHTVAVQVNGAGGKWVSADRTINVLAAAPSEPGKYDRAVRLLDRMAFGAEPRELAAVLTMGEEAWLRERLWKSDDAGDRAGFESSCVRFTNNRDYNDVQRRAFGHASYSENPVRARFVFWLNNHFTTWIRKVEPDLKWAEYAMFARLGPSTFPELLYASATSPAMLRYLDQERSVTGKLNENYAREIMELHTLGVHAGYKQEDVMSLAKVLNGWTTYAAAEGRGFGAVRDLEFRYDPKLNSGKGARVFGMDFDDSSPGERFDRVQQAIEMLAAHPATAEFVARSLLEHYVCCPPPEEMVAECAKVFKETGGDMREVLLAAAKHPAFWSSQDRIAQPIDYAVKMSRMSGSPNVNSGNDYLRRSRQGLFDCATPNGYSDKDADYVDSNAMLQRLRLARESMYNIAVVVPNNWRYAGDKDANLPEDWNQRVVDVIAVRLTGRTLGEASNGAALKIIAETEGNRDTRVREAAVFIAQSPEASLR